MELEPIAAAHGPNGISEHTESSFRLTELNKIYFAHYGELQSTIYQHTPQTLVWDADKLLSALAARLDRYAGPINEDEFMRWAKAFVRREADRYQITATILQEQRRVIYAAIHRFRWTSATDKAVTADDIFAEVAALVFRKAHEFNRPGIAATKMATRITGLVKRHVTLYHNHHTGRRRRAVQRHLDLCGTLEGAETLSPEELRSMRADEPWDAGYSEAGLSLE